MNVKVMKLILQQLINQCADNKSQDQKIVSLFEKVRDIPYGYINSRNPLDVYNQNKGTCSGKHELLKALYEELNIPVKNFIVKHNFKDLPNDISKLLGPKDMFDLHNFLKIKINNKWITVDATWDKDLEELGFPVNHKWDGKSDMQLAVKTQEEVREVKDPIASKVEFINQLPKDVRIEREMALKAFNNFLEDFRDNKLGKGL
jgi:hypothetical protein